MSNPLDCRAPPRPPMKDKFKAVWLSHSSISDYLKCPRLYFLRNVYKSPKTNRKMTIMSPALALGQATHEVIEALSELPVDERLTRPLSESFEQSWKKVEGKLGGFFDSEKEMLYKDRGLKMLKNIEEHPGPILKKAVKLKSEDGLPYYWFSENENIILCGKIDWIEYLPETDSVHLLDFKTGRIEEDEESLQLPIYFLLASNLQNREITKASYWYLDKDEEPKEMKLPSKADAEEKVGKIAQRVKLARQLEHFNCPNGGCRYCTPFERVLKGEGEMVTISNYGQEIYILKD